MTFDKDSNVTQTTYPDGTLADMGYDFADRPVTLDVTPPGGVIEAVVSNTVYLPSGPIERLDFASGISEARDFTTRYHTDRIRLGPTATFPDGTLLDWDYTVDVVGNVMSIVDGTGGASGPARTFSYLPHQYFLTDAAGPWLGPLAWTYDKTGNRLTELRNRLFWFLHRGQL